MVAKYIQIIHFQLIKNYIPNFSLFCNIQTLTSHCSLQDRKFYINNYVFDDQFKRFHTKKNWRFSISIEQIELFK